MILKENVRVRFEKTSDGYDLGLKMSAFGEEFERVQIKNGSSRVVQFVGKLEQGPKLNVGRSANGDSTVRLMFVDGVLVIAMENQLITRHTSGEITCQPGKGESLAQFAEMLRAAGEPIVTKALSVPTASRVVQALGL